MPELQAPEPVQQLHPPLPGWNDLINDEMIDQFAALNTRQQHAIRRIIEAGHYSDNPPAPTAMIGNTPESICTPANWWGNPHAGKDGKWRRIPWTRQPEFMRVLALAKRRALSVIDSTEQEQLRQARSIARANATPVMRNMIGIATQTDDSKAAVSAATLVLKYSGMDSAERTVVEMTTVNWWSAAEDDI